MHIKSTFKDSSHQEELKAPKHCTLKEWHKGEFIVSAFPGKSQTLYYGLSTVCSPKSCKNMVPKVFCWWYLKGHKCQLWWVQVRLFKPLDGVPMMQSWWLEQQGGEHTVTCAPCHLPRDVWCLCQARWHPQSPNQCGLYELWTTRTLGQNNLL